MIGAAREAFVNGMHITAALAGISAIVLAALAIATLRHVRTPSGSHKAAGSLGDVEATAAPAPVA